MTAWLLLVTAGFNIFAISGVATQADCDTLAAALQQATTQALAHACISYEAVSAQSEVHIFGPPPGAAPATPVPPSFQLKAKPKTK